MVQDHSFNGFPKESVRFFVNLAKNNNKPWFEAHREKYGFRDAACATICGGDGTASYKAYHPRSTPTRA
jgi:hypothetical protein